jgi:hypothetical protein
MLAWLQLQYSESPQFSVFLYIYGKQIIKKNERQYFGSAIGALQEVQRCCVTIRVQNALFYQGKAYEMLG